MEQTIELRIVDPKTLNYADKRDPRQVPADRLSDAALKANSNAIGFVQPPLFSEEGDGTLTIIAGRRRIRSAIANKLKEMAILVKPADPLDDMRAVAENVVRAPMSPIDLWRVNRRSRLEELDGGSDRDSLRRAAPTGPQAPAPWQHPSRDARAHGPRRHARGAIPPHDRRGASLRTGRRVDEAEAEEGPDGLLVRDRQFSRQASDVRPRREVRREGAGRLRHRLDRRPVRPGRRGQPLHDRRRRLSWRAARLARSQRSEERGNRSGRRLRRCQAPEGRDPGLGRQARQKGSRRALRRPAKRGGQRGLFHAACRRRKGVEDRRRRQRGCSGR